MKLYLLSIVILGLLFNGKTNQGKEIPLVKPRENFKLAILDDVTTYKRPGETFIVLKIKEQNNPGTNIIELSFWRQPISIFGFSSEIKEKCLGYFEYNTRTILVYGDGSSSYFFSTTDVKKQFDFLSIEPYNSKKDGQVISYIDEIIPFIYEYKEGEFIRVQ